MEKDTLPDPNRETLQKLDIHIKKPLGGSRINTLIYHALIVYATMNNIRVSINPSTYVNYSGDIIYDFTKDNRIVTIFPFTTTGEDLNTALAKVDFYRNEITNELILIPYGIKYTSEVSINGMLNYAAKQIFGIDGHAVLVAIVGGKIYIINSKGETPTKLDKKFTWVRLNIQPVWDGINCARYTTREAITLAKRYLTMGSVDNQTFIEESAEYIKGLATTQFSLVRINIELNNIAANNELNFKL